MVHRAHLDDPTLVKFDAWHSNAFKYIQHVCFPQFLLFFSSARLLIYWLMHVSAKLGSGNAMISEDFTNLKMPDGNVEPLISPKLAVAMESFLHRKFDKPFLLHCIVYGISENCNFKLNCTAFLNEALYHANLSLVRPDSSTYEFQTCRLILRLCTCIS